MQMPTNRGNALPRGSKLQGGRYVIDGTLGEGAFGITYRATDMRLNRPVAIKELYPGGSQRRGNTITIPAGYTRERWSRSVASFLREAQTIANLEHPAIVTVHDQFEENGTAYMVMRFIDGVNLMQLAQQGGGRFPEADVLRYIAEVGDALGVLHQSGVLHRDVKPSNIIVNRSGRAVLVDFGAAREFVADQTMTHSVVLTPGFAPPEQLLPRARRGPTTDIYALAATCYYLLTADLPDVDLDGRLDDNRLPPRIRAALEQALAYNPLDRPQTVAAFLAELQGRATVPPLPIHQVSPTAPTMPTPRPVYPQETAAQREYQRNVAGDETLVEGGQPRNPAADETFVERGQERGYTPPAYPISASIPYWSDTNQPRPRRNAILPIAGGGLAALALLVVLAVLLLGGRGSAVGGGTATPVVAATTPTSLLAAATQTPVVIAIVPPTDTLLPTSTPMPPSPTQIPTDTPVLPTNTAVPLPTDTPTNTNTPVPLGIPPNSSFTGSTGAFRWRQGEDAPTMDPALMQDSVSINVAQNFYDGLTEFNPTNLAVEPAIASKWDVSPDGSVYTFHLRNDVKFTNGDPVKASDFVYSWNRLLANPQAPYGFVFADIKGANDVMSSASSTDTGTPKLTQAEGIKALDDYTLQVTLNGPSAYFLTQTALWSYWVVNKNVVGPDPLSSAWADAGKMNGVGTGSYTLSVWAHNDHMVMLANDNYWGAVKPSVKEIDMLIIADGSTAQLRYESGQLDSSELFTADYQRIKNDPTLSPQLHEVPQARTVWLGFNATDTDPNNPFAASNGDSAKDLRIAIAESIDRTDLIDKALDGIGSPAYTLVPQGVPGYNAYKAYDLNLTDAKAKLAASGVNLANLNLTYTTRDREDQNKVAAVAQAQLKQNLGLNVAVKSVPWTTFLTERQAHHYNFFYGSWGQDYPDPQDWLFPLAVSAQPENSEGYSNKTFDQLVTTANVLADPTKQAQRFAMYNQAEKMYLDNATIVPLYQFQTDFMLETGWSGWGYNAQFVYPFRYLKKSNS